MTVSFVGAASAEATSVTLPAHQRGDLLVVFAWNGASTTIPSVPTGWRIAYAFANTTGASRAGVVAYKNAASASEASGTWTSAELLGCAVYRDDANYLTIGGVNGQVNFNSNTITHRELQVITQSANLTKLRAESSYILRMAACTSNSSDIETPPSLYTNRVAIAGASANELVIHESNTSLASQVATNQTINQTVVASTVTVEILDTTIVIPAGSGMLVHPGMAGGMRG